MKTAKFLHLDEDVTRGVAGLYLLSEPYRGHSYVMASSVSIAGTDECYIFPADAAGDVLEWDELFGLRETTDHAVTLGAMGYEIE